MTGVLKAWDIWAEKYNLGDGAEIAHATHGRRLYDTMKELCHIEEEEKLQVRALTQTLNVRMGFDTELNCV
jgi:hypothetical protein